VKWNTARQRSADAAPPDPRWPVAARNLLTKRERFLYDLLLCMYPDHKIFVQVALSQLIDVPEGRPDRQSIRARFKQLVADFVLCRPDLSIVAVIELDDRSHERADRRAADARKTKAVADAGLKLVRVPAGTLPTSERLRELIEQNPAANATEGLPEHALKALANGWGRVESDSGGEDRERVVWRAVRMAVLKVAFVGVVLVGGWVFVTKILPMTFQQALQPLAARATPPVMPRTAVPSRPAAVPAPVAVPATSTAAGPTVQELAEQRRAAFLAAGELQREKNHAWLAYYSAPASCEHPVDWTAQVECGNQYMRAKQVFEAQWAKEHDPGKAVAPVVVLGNGSVGGLGR
jgi:hypothetical protein